MNKDNILFATVGLLTGLIVGFIFANSINDKNTVAATSAGEMQMNSNLPPGHPDIGAAGNLQAGLEQARTAAANAAQMPGDFETQLKAAEAYYQVEKFDEAITYLSAANKLRPDDREILVHLGNAYFDAGKYDAAQKWYTDALAKKSDDVNVRTDLGLTYVFREPPDFDKAIEEFNKALAIDPNHIQTLQNLTVAYTKKSDAASANRVLAKLEAADPQNISISRLRNDIEALAKK